MIQQKKRMTVITVMMAAACLGGFGGALTTETAIQQTNTPVSATVVVNPQQLKVQFDKKVR